MSFVQLMKCLVICLANHFNENSFEESKQAEVRILAEAGVLKKPDAREMCDMDVGPTVHVGFMQLKCWTMARLTKNRDLWCKI